MSLAANPTDESRVVLGRAARIATTALVGGLSLWATISVVGTPSDQCDNMAGTCIHMRQELAIGVVRLVCVAATIGCLALAVSFRGGPVRRRQAIALALLALIAIVVLATDPVSHLNNRWTGWFGGNP